MMQRRTQSDVNWLWERWCEQLHEANKERNLESLRDEERLIQLADEELKLSKWMDAQDIRQEQGRVRRSVEYQEKHDAE